MPVLVIPNEALIISQQLGFYAKSVGTFFNSLQGHSHTIRYAQLRRTAPCKATFQGSYIPRNPGWFICRTLYIPPVFYGTEWSWCEHIILVLLM